jgi:hypothetical protein
MDGSPTRVESKVIAGGGGIAVVLAAGGPADNTAGLARSLTALRIGLDVLGDAVMGGGPGLDIGALAKVLDAAVCQVAGAANVPFADPLVGLSPVR